MSEHHLCPVWVGYFLSCPLRKLYQNPTKILSGYVNTGMTVLDFGCAMGFFSLPLAEMVGENGKVFCIDIQQKMIESLRKRARKSKLLDRIETRVCKDNPPDLEYLKSRIDFALASAVIHEVVEPEVFLSQIHSTMKTDGKFLIMEPKGHVTKKDFEQTISIADKTGFEIVEEPRIRNSLSVLLRKK